MRCVLLHGFAGDRASWDDVAIDGDRVALPGHLGGDPPAADWRSNLDRIAQQIGQPDVVIGYSLGARVALGLVLGGHAGRGVLISVNPGIDDDERAARRANDATWARRARAEGIAAFLGAWEAQPLFATQRRASPARLAARRARRLALDPAQLAASLEAMGLAEMPDYRPQLDERFTWIAGADDARYVALARAHATRVVVVEDSGHDPLLEQPAALTVALRRALDG